MSDWSVKLGSHGEVVSGLDDIHQAILIILATRKGTDPMRPEFGSDLWKYIDRPLPWAVPHIIRESWDAVRQWEERAEVVRVEVEPGNGKVLVRVVWRPVDGGSEEVTVYGG